MTDTELLDYLEKSRRVPMPAFDVQPSTGGASNARFVGWSINGETTYPTLRAAIEAMTGARLRRVNPAELERWLGASS